MTMSSNGRLDYELLWSQPYEELRKLTRAWYDAYLAHNGLRRYEQSPILAEITDMKLIMQLESIFGDQRDRIETKIKELTEETPEWQEWGKGVVGLGQLTLGKLLGLVGCPAARTYASTFRKHCGYGVTDGKADRRTKSEKLCYNNRAKSHVYVIVTQFLKAYPRSPNIYGELFYQWKVRYEEKHPEWTTMHRYFAALRKVASLFLSHLWEISRRAHGLPAYSPYAIEYLNHATYIPPEVALHPRKYRSDVADAVTKVLYSIEFERDKEVKEFFQGVVASFSEKLSKR